MAVTLCIPTKITNLYGAIATINKVDSKPAGLHAQQHAARLN